MIKQVRFNKQQRVVDELVHRIESGLLADGNPLPGEDQLAQELGVSHSTLRAALTETVFHRIHPRIHAFCARFTGLLNSVGIFCQIHVDFTHLNHTLERIC